MKDAAYRQFLKVYRVLPRRLRRTLVRAGTPKFTVGAICIVQRDDGRVLLARHSYWSRWGTPGGLAQRGEHPETTAVRETREGRSQLSFLLNPTRMDDVRRVCESGEVMPQKSTFFYPKIIDGFALQRL